MGATEPFSPSAGQTRDLTNSVPGVRQVHTLPLPGGRGLFRLCGYRSLERLEPFRTPRCPPNVDSLIARRRLDGAAPLGRRRMTWPLTRGQVVRAEIGPAEPKLFVVVSNNRRNRRLGDVLAARLTTSAEPNIPSIVELAGESLAGRVVCDDLVALSEEEILTLVGALSPRTMRAVDRGLAAALGLGV